MHAYIFIYIIHVHIYIYIYIYMHIYTCIHCMDAYKHHLQPQTHTNTHEHTAQCIHTHADHICIYTLYNHSYILCTIQTEHYQALWLLPSINQACIRSILVTPPTRGQEFETSLVTLACILLPFPQYSLQYNLTTPYISSHTS